MYSLKAFLIGGFVALFSLLAQAGSNEGNYICTTVYGPVYTAHFELVNKKASFFDGDARTWIDVPFANVDVTKSTLPETVYQFEKVSDTKRVKVEFNLTRKSALVTYLDELSQRYEIIQLQACTNY